MQSLYFDVKTRWKIEEAKFLDARRYDNIRARLIKSPYDLARPQLLPENFFRRLEYILEHISLAAKGIGEVQTEPRTYRQILDDLIINRLDKSLRGHLYDSTKAILGELEEYDNLEDYTTVAAMLIAAAYTILERDPPSALDGVPNVYWFFGTDNPPTESAS